MKAISNASGLLRESFNLGLCYRRVDCTTVPVLNLLTLMTAPSVAFVTLETKCCKELTTAEAATTGSIVKCGIAAARQEIMSVVRQSTCWCLLHCQSQRCAAQAPRK